MVQELPPFSQTITGGGDKDEADPPPPLRDPLTPPSSPFPIVDGKTIPSMLAEGRRRALFKWSLAAPLFFFSILQA